MNLTVNSQLLAAELRLLTKVAPSKPTIAILGHVRLKAEVGALALQATDLEVGLSTRCPAEVHVPGVIALPVAKVLALVEQFPDADVSLALDQTSQVTVRCGAFASRLRALPAEDFPTLPEVEGTSCVLNAEGLQRLIARTRHAGTVEDTRYFLHGALLTLAGPTATMVATDSHRLALATGPRPDGEDARVIIPARALDLLARQTETGDLTFTVGTRHLFFQAGERLLTSRTIDGQFPQYDRVIPKGNDKIVSVGRDALAAALHRMEVLSDRNRAVSFDFTPRSLHLSSSSVEVGSADEDLAISYDGPPLKVAVDGGYVLDFLAVASESTITLTLKDPTSAMLLTSGSDHTEVIMLMRM